MKTESGHVHWLGEEDYLCCQGALFLASSPTEFNANGTCQCTCRCACARSSFTIPFNSRQLTNITTWCYRRLNWFSHSIIHTISQKCTFSLIICSTSLIILPWDSRNAQCLLFFSTYSVVFISYKNSI